MSDAPMQHAFALYDQCRWDEAGAALESALAGQSGDAEGWYRLGNVRTEQGHDAEALECFSRTLALAPTHAKARNNFGAACERLSRHSEALQAYQRALENDPKLFEPYLNLGRLHESFGEPARAAAYFRTGLEHYPGNPMLTHLLAAVSGEESAPRVPREHVASYFDGFAEHFDEYVVGRLGYRLPETLAELLGPRLIARGDDVVDLGCGTGLVGAALAARGARLVGVDLSAGMLERARKRGVYAELVLADIEDALRARAPKSFRAALAADVLIYIGDLSGVLREVSRVLASGGVFAFSIEALETGDYRLQTSGRYAHSLDYVRRLAAHEGLREKLVRAVRVRGATQGSLLVLERL